MRRIYKYEINPKDHVNCDISAQLPLLSLPVEMPEDAEILSVAFQGDELFVWALVDPEVKTKKFVFNVFGTGWAVPANPGKFIGTAHHRTQRLVFHVFLDTSVRLHSA